MNVTRPTPTTATDIITLAAMKEFLRVDHDDEDATITAMMDAAVAHCSDVTNRHFTANSEGVFYLPYFRPAALAFGPVTNVQSVQYYDTAGDLQTLNTALWWVEARDNQVWRIFFRDTPDLEDYNATPVVVTCRVGKVASPNIKHAIKMIVAHWYETRRAVVVGSGIGSSEVPMAVNALLNPERLETAWQ
jgi:uncharacterized phiE125 gp8 family phage protein